MDHSTSVFNYNDILIMLKCINDCVELLGDYKLTLVNRSITTYQFNHLINDMLRYKFLLEYQREDIDLIYDELLTNLINYYSLSKYDFITPDYINRARLVRQGQLIRPRPMKKHKPNTEAN